MAHDLKISIGQHSERGRKESNQDFHGAMIPAEPPLSLKGSRGGAGRRDQQQPVSREASESAVKSFLTRLLLHVRIRGR